MSVGLLSDYFTMQWLMNHGGQLWLVFRQILFANKATEMAYLVFAGAIATESKVNTSYSNAAVLIVIRIT